MAHDAENLQTIADLASMLEQMQASLSQLVRTIYGHVPTAPARAAALQQQRQVPTLPPVGRLERGMPPCPRRDLPCIHLLPPARDEQPKPPPGRFSPEP